jgi:hypothetical protein
MNLTKAQLEQFDKEDIFFSQIVFPRRNKNFGK